MGVYASKGGGGRAPPSTNQKISASWMSEIVVRFTTSANTRPTVLSPFAAQGPAGRNPPGRNEHDLSAVLASSKASYALLNHLSNGPMKKEIVTLFIAAFAIASV